MIAAAVLLHLVAAAPQQAPPPAPEPPPAAIVVSAPLRATDQTPATLVVEPVAMMFATFDADGDALVDRSETLGGVRESFLAMDPTGTGRLRYLAFADWALRFLGDRNALPSPFEVDRNQDNAITLDELQDQFSRLFARYDVNGDKTISRAELMTYRTRPVDGQGPTGGRPAKPGAGKPGGKPGTARPRVPGGEDDRSDDAGERQPRP